MRPSSQRKSRVLAALHANPVLGCASDSTLSALAKKAELVAVNALEPLYSAKSPLRDVLIITDGVARLFVEDSSGLQVTLLHARAPTILGYGAPVGAANPLGESAMALSKCTVVRVDCAVLENCVRTDSALCHAMLYHWVAHCSALSAANAIRLRDTTSQLAALVLAYADVFGVSTIHGTKITCNMTQDTLANGVGVVRRSVGRVLSKWKRDGIVSVRKGWYVIQDRPALEDACGGTHQLLTTCSRGRAREAHGLRGLSEAPVAC